MINGMLVMTNKKNTINGSKADVTPPLGELEQLRQIVFGDAHQQLVNDIKTMRNDFDKALKAQEQNFSIRLEAMKENNEQQSQALEKRINLFDKNHDDQEAIIQKDLTNLASEHEMLATATQEDFKNMARQYRHF